MNVAFLARSLPHFNSVLPLEPPLESPLEPVTHKYILKLLPHTLDTICAFALK